MSDTVLTQTVILLFLLGAAILFRHRQYLGVSRSNLEDEFRTTSSSPPSNGSCTIKALYIYPIKSCQGIEVSRATIVSTGFQHDRQFTFAERKRDGGQWRFVTQREYPLLARVRVALDLRRGVVRASWGWWPWERFEVRLEEQGHEVLRVRVWKDEPEAWRMPVRLERLGRFLGVRGELALCRVKERRTVLRCAPRKELLGWQPVVGFADAYPLHILNLASVHDLNSKISNHLPNLSPKRFRANILLSGPRPYDEDDWKRFEINGHTFFVACRTVRCKMPNVHPDTGERHPTEPDRALRRFREIDQGARGMGCLGMQVVPEEEEGFEVCVGDELVVRERGEHFYIRQ